MSPYKTLILSANSAGCSGGDGGRGAERDDPVAGHPHTALPPRFCPGPKPTQPGPANSPTVSTSRRPATSRCTPADGVGSASPASGHKPGSNGRGSCGPPPPRGPAALVRDRGS